MVPGDSVVVRRPDILLVEGLNVLQPPRLRADGPAGRAVSDYFDFSVYVDAATADIERWYVERFLAAAPHRVRRPRVVLPPLRLAVRRGGPRDGPRRSGCAVNEPNLVTNILPTRGRATVVLEKGPDHAVRRVRLRRL